MADHYDVLGVPRDASADDIKKAYRRLARQLHPDVNPSPEAAEKFKDVTAAYDTLSDAGRRQQYDMGGAAGRGDAFGFGDLFSAFFGGQSGGRGPRSRAEPGQDALVRVDLELREVIFGTHRDIEVNTAERCPDCEGSCCADGTHPVPCTACNGTGQVTQQVRSMLGPVMTTAPCSVCQGYGDIIEHPCETCRGQGRVRARIVIPVDIPAGVDTGLRVQLPGRGEAGPAGGVNGDLYIEVRVRDDDAFARSGDDLQCVLEVSMTDAVFGTTTTIAALDGDVEVTIPEGTQSGEVLTVKQRGVTRLRSTARGDLDITVQVVTPTRLDSTQRDLLEKFATRRKGSESPRLVREHVGVFSKLRNRFGGR